MTEASSNTMTAGPAIGGGAASNKDIVNGLDGLRLLIERRQGEGKSKQNARRSEPRLVNDNTILAITGKHPRVYVLEGDRLRVYNSESVNGETDKLNSAVNRLDADKFLIRRNRAVAGQRMLINKSMADELSVVNGGVAYRDYLLKLNNSAIDVVKAMLAQRPKKMKLAQKKNGDSDNNNAAKMEGAGQDNHSNADTVGLLGKVAKVKRIADRVARSEATPRDAMELFLTLGQASPKILKDLLSLPDEEAASIIDSLRRMGGIGERDADGTYPILIDRADELIDSDNPKESQASFCAAVHKEEVDGVELRYDLDEISRISWADEFVRSVADYTRSSRNSRVNRLFRNESESVKLSRLLRTLSNDDGRANFADLSLFSDIVLTDVMTKDMVSSNPTDSFPWAVWQVLATDNLKESMLRYLATNIEWIMAVLSEEQLESLARQIANITFDKATNQRRNLQKVISLRYAAVVDAMRIKSDVADGQQAITLK